MKTKLIIMLFLLFASKVEAQSNKIDSIYYLIDTAKVPSYDRMWRIESDDVYKFYDLQCPCLKYNGKPRFYYSLTDKDGKGRIIERKEFRSILLISLADLIVKAKKVLDTNLSSPSFNFIEPFGKKYIMHSVGLINPEIKIVALPDVIEKHEIDTSAFKAKGLLEINIKRLAKNIDKSVIISGRIVDGKEDDVAQIDWLKVTGDSPEQYFLIVIKGKNRHNFYPIKDYMGRKVRVTGKVIKYNDKPALELTDDNQIQIKGR